MFKKLSIFLILVISITLVGCEDSTKKVEKKKNEQKVIEKEEKKEEPVEEVKDEIVEEAVTEEQKETEKKTEIKISYTSIKTMKQNHEHKLNASASGANISYNSSNTKCVTVSKTGNMKAVWISNKEECNSTITITATKNDTTKKEAFTVTVKKDTTPPIIECSIYKETKNGVYLSVKKSDDESGLKEECDPYCIMPIYTKTSTHEVYDKAGNVSTCTVKVWRDCPRGYTGLYSPSELAEKSCSKKYSDANETIHYVQNCKEKKYSDLAASKCEKSVVTGEEAQSLCGADSCDKELMYNCTCKEDSCYHRHLKLLGKVCYEHPSDFVLLGEIVN